MDSDGVNRLALEPSALKAVEVKAEWGRCISSWEDVSVHEETPDEVLILPRLAEARNLQEEDSVVIEHIVNLSEERLEVTDTNVLSHLKAGDLVVAAGWNWDITVIHAQDSALLLWNASSAEASVAPGSLVATKGNAGNVGAKVNAGELGKSSPSAANIEHSLAALEINLLADNGELVVLELLKGLLSVDVGDDARSVNHAWAEEPSVEVITAVVVVADLFLV